MHQLVKNPFNNIKMDGKDVIIIDTFQVTASLSFILSSTRRDVIWESESMASLVLSLDTRGR